MCLLKNKKGKPLLPPVKSASCRATQSQSKVAIDLSKKKTSSAPAKVPDRQTSTQPESQGESSAKEKTCISDRSDLMQISLYKNTKKKEGGSGSIEAAAKPADDRVDSPEVFENNSQVVSLNPVNVPQIFVDSVIPQTNVSRQHTDIIDQNTLENVEPNMEDMIFDQLDSGEEQFPEMPQPRPLANVLQPEDDTVAGENTLSEDRHPSRPSEKRVAPAKTSNANNERRISTTPDRLPSVFTPQAPTKSEKVFHTCKRAVRGPLSTRTAHNQISRPRQSTDFRSPAARTPPLHGAHDAGVDNTLGSHEPLDRVTQRTVRARPHASHAVGHAPATEYRTVIQTAMPMEPRDKTCGSREAVVDTATAKKTAAPPSCVSNIYTAHMNPNKP